MIALWIWLHFSSYYSPIFFKVNLCLHQPCTVLQTFSTLCLCKWRTFFVCLYVSHAVHTANTDMGFLFESFETDWVNSAEEKSPIYPKTLSWNTFNLSETLNLAVSLTCCYVWNGKVFWRLFPFMNLWISETKHTILNILCRKHKRNCRCTNVALHDALT